MIYLLEIFSVVWLIRTVKSFLFFLYLWQLKEYHVARFISHFQTDKGKSILLGKLPLLKIVIAAVYVWLLLVENFFGQKPILTLIVGFLLCLYLVEVVLFFRSIIKKSFKIPTLTFKSGFLVLLAVILEALIFYLLTGLFEQPFVFIFCLFCVDIFSIAIISALVLVFQPFTVLYRNVFILNRAKKIISGRKDLTVIGITGSYGKTSVKEFLAVVLSEKFNVLKTEKHRNSEMGISKCIIEDLKPEHNVFIVEMGAYGKGGIKLLSDISQPKIGILTGINQQHISLFGSQEAIMNTKYELIQSLPKDGLAIFNGDNGYCLKLYADTKMPKRLYMVKNDFTLKPDIWAENISVFSDCLVFEVCAKSGKKAKFKVNVLGGQNIANILGAVLIATELGMTLEEAARGAAKISQEQGAMKLLKDSNDPYFLDSSYSANYDGVLADLDYLKTWKGKKAIIMPCLIELGDEAKKIHMAIGKKIAETCDLAIITTSDYYDVLKTEAISAGMKQESIYLSDNVSDIMSYIQAFSNPGDVVLLEGRISEALIKEIREKP